MANSMSKVPLVQTLRDLLRDVLRQRDLGVPSARFARSLGYTDGYMQALIDAGVAEERELLHMVAEERRRADGPGSAELPAVSEFEERAVA